MKFTLVATTFAALLDITIGNNVEAAPAAGAETVDTQGGLVDGETGSRAVLSVPLPTRTPPLQWQSKVDDATADTNGEKRALKKKKDYSGQSCSLCCDDDYHCFKRLPPRVLTGSSQGPHRKDDTREVS
jgi:hypothetical protein